MVLQIVYDLDSDVFREELALLSAVLFVNDCFRNGVSGKFERSEISHDAIPVALYDVISVEQRRYGRGVCGRSSDFEFLHLLHEACFCVSLRMNGQAFQSGDRFPVHDLSDLELRQCYVLLVRVVGIVVASFEVNLQESVEKYVLGID